jgi:aryl-alcohol dehydrogenase-like predicted oxidoreductase
MKQDDKTKTSLSRRGFLGAALAASGVAAGGAAWALQQKGAARADAPQPLPAGNATGQKKTAGPKNPTDKVLLGKSGLKVSLVGLGTGTVGSGNASNQTRLGDAGFKNLMRHGFDKGISLFDLADSYGSNPFFARAMQGVPRDQYVIQTKTGSRDPQAAKADIDRFLRELNTDYIDSVLIHCVTEGDWTTRYRGVMDALEEAKQAGKIRAHGVSCHSFEALQAALASDWVQTHLVRWNARRSHMDADVETARETFLKMRGKGQGLIGMKVMGEGRLVRGRNAMPPEECLRFQIESGVVHAFVVGVEKTEHIDTMLNGTRQALADFGYRAV